MAESKNALTKTEKAAILFLCMDEKTTESIFSQMQDKEIRTIGAALMNLSKIPAETINEVISEFYEKLQVRDTGPQKLGDVTIDDGERLAENLLKKSLPKSRSKGIITSIWKPPELEMEDTGGSFNKFIQQLTPEVLYNLLKQEHPQVIAICIANAKKRVARETLMQFPVETQVEVLSRIAALDKISGEIIDQLKESIIKKITADQAKRDDSGAAIRKRPKTDFKIEGVDWTVKILKSLKKDASEKILDDILKIDVAIGNELSKKMFTMEDLMRSSAPGIRELLRGVTNDDLKIALKDAPEELKNVFLSNMSERASMIIREDMEVMGPLKVEEIEAAQQNILKVAKELIKEEKMKLEDISEESDDE